MGISVPDTIKWAVAIGVLAAGIATFYIYPEQSQFLRIVGVLIAAVIAVGVAVQTEKGRELWSFIKEARTELRKVVWPARKETLNTTALVIVVVVIVGVLLWVLDGILVRVVKAILSAG